MKNYIHDAGKIGDGFATERLDCAVRAYAIAKEIPYSESHDLFHKAGRVNEDYTYISTYKNLGFNFIFTNITLKRFIDEHPIGSFYVCMKGHAFAVKNGIVFDDSKLSGKIRVKKWFEVKI